MKTGLASEPACFTLLSFAGKAGLSGEGGILCQRAQPRIADLFNSECIPSYETVNGWANFMHVIQRRRQRYKRDDTVRLGRQFRVGHVGYGVFLLHADYQ